MQFHLELNHNMFPENWINLYNHTILMSDNNQLINLNNDEIKCLKMILDENNVKFDDNIFQNITYREIGIFLLKSLMITKNKIRRDNRNYKNKLRRLIKITPNQNRINEFEKDIEKSLEKDQIIEEEYQLYYSNLNRFIIQPYTDTHFTSLLNLNQRRLNLGESQFDENYLGENPMDYLL